MGFAHFVRNGSAVRQENLRPAQSSRQQVTQLLLQAQTIAKTALANVLNFFVWQFVPMTLWNVSQMILRLNVLSAGAGLPASRFARRLLSAGAGLPASRFARRAGLW